MFPVYCVYHNIFVVSGVCFRGVIQSRTVLICQMANDYELTRWSRRIRIRDGGRCLVCRGQFDIWRLQAHHIYPKSLYPEKALDLGNGVSCCTGCHMGHVHRGNSFKDTDPDNMESGWRLFSPMFLRYVGLSAQREYNEEFQER